VARAIHKVLIANRGEIAVRVIRSCRELGLETVAVYSEADRLMPHVQLADEAYCIGPPPSAQSYLVMDKILDVARLSRADALHPGYGFLSENAEFARRVVEAGITFIGPEAEAIRTMGDKTTARRVVASAGVPVVPGTEAVANEQDAHAFCREHGFPVLIKAAAGGGGKGMRLVRSMEEFSSAFAGAQSEALSAFGDPRVYVEKYLENPRHIEFQIVADESGNTVHLGERECTIQRRHQKVVEESPSVLLDDALRKLMGETAVRAAKACGYRNAGTIEFLVDRNRRFYFLEMNTRLQVEHPVTEMRTGVDLVALQIRIARGESLPWRQEEIGFRGHAIECRICAEDPLNDFLPSTGKIAHLRPPHGFGIRDDRGVEAGGEIAVYYDPLIAKLIAWAPTRTEALRRMDRALGEYEVLGVQTNIPFCRFVINHELFRRGDIDTHFVATHYRPDLLEKPDEGSARAAALVCAWLELGGGAQGAEEDRPPSSGRTERGKWKYDRSRFLRGNES